ncbi:ATP-binding cassette domain-containing protein [Glycomyces algeriensis]|uniref:Daunorubicin resistance protein DrrA family ABC transporter ATP-binding protein n=1 Tax=Glycomyces algeriensis TaxID=256037 RepID=A0A9W6GCW0_9ACTN|nr:ATP-binding cassette domain-containing protein [Glycomyces algeriensis]MDA1366738.1 ATP-binding cassette domain-containing protein [Glycomyces algeriensis]MDR7351625.1 daunorubicin resistance ABC transporter ATP-binding subunit [Glycomyces algeriensis]GLI44348.1 daunorubicin resistance protein DrrA family ABC transporter ATP-binding protein [Glycomyces algeriensis]
MRYAIEVRGLKKSFGEVQALSGVDFAAAPGTVLGVLGPNGAGKTTAVRVLSTLTRPDAGTARVLGLDVTAQAAQVRERIGLTGQYAGLDPNLSGEQNLVLVARLLGASRRQAKARANELIERFDLAHAATRAASKYSGGMRRRLDLAASIVRRPEVLFLDEPTTGLDPKSRNGLWEVVRDLVASGTTVLLTTQYLEEADQLADSIAVIDTGRVIASGTPSQLKQAVGGQVLRLSPTRPDASDQLVQLAEWAVGAQARAEGGDVLVPVAHAGEAQAVMARVSQAGVDLAGFGLHEPTLDEVFLQLTGHRTRTDETTKEPVA